MSGDISFIHHALLVMIHPNTTIGKNVTFYHNVTVASNTWIGSPTKIIIEDDVSIGTGVVIVARADTNLVIGKGAVIGANSLVTRDVAPYDRVGGNPARSLKQNAR